MCNYVITTNDHLCCCICAIILCVSSIFIWWYGRLMINCVRIIFLAICLIEFLARYLGLIDSSYKIDVLIIYLSVWQLTSAEWRLILQQLSSPVFITGQGLFCIFVVIMSFATHDGFCRYLPFQINFIFF
jgi:hypothetical protein